MAQDTNRQMARNGEAVGLEQGANRRSTRRPRSIASLCVFGVAVVLYALTMPPANPDAADARAHVYQAAALLHGHAYIDPVVLNEEVKVDGHAYILHPPLAAIAMLPLVSVLGTGANPAIVSILLAAVAVALVYGLTGSLWLAVFFGFGTPIWYEATQGASWGFCLVLSTVPTLLTLKSIKDFRSIGFTVGLWAGLAALARYDLVLAWPLYPIYVFNARFHKVADATETPEKFKVTHYALGLLPAIVAYIAWSYVRFGTFTDKALWLWYQVDPYAKAHPGGPFSLANLSWNLYTALFMAPMFNSHGFPWIRPWGMGEALIFTSPALILALRASWRRVETWVLWACVFGCMAAGLTVYANGFVQFGARYWIQVMPFLIALMGMSRLRQDGKILIAASVAMCAFQLWQIHTMGFVGPLI